jgi:hypothetical protein
VAGSGSEQKRAGLAVQLTITGNNQKGLNRSIALVQSLLFRQLKFPALELGPMSPNGHEFN